MAGLFGGSSVDTSAPVISSLQIQTSSYGRPMTWVFGRARVAPNLIQYEDFTPHAHTTESGGGKGGGGSTHTDYTYTVAPIMALASGPLKSVGRIWKDKEQSGLALLGLDFYQGDNEQTPYPYLLSKHPDRALSYRGISYVASGSYDLGNNASLGNHNFEVQAPGSIDEAFPASGVPDCEINSVIGALLTDPDQGVGLDPSSIAAADQFRDFCLASRLWVSPAYTEQRPAYEHIKNLLTIGFADCVYSGGQFKIVPYSDVPVIGELATYTPNIIVRAELGEDDFIASADQDPIRISQKSSKELYNDVQVKFADRANDYNDNIAHSSDPADIEMYGVRPMDVVDFKEIADAEVAQKVTDFLLHRALYINNEYEFHLSWGHVLLEPMDVVTLTYPRKSLDQVPVLIISIEEDEDGLLTVLAEDYPLGTNRPSAQHVPAIGNDWPNYSIECGDAAAPVLFEPPGNLAGPEPQIWLATAGGDHWGGCVVWASTDDISYQNIGTLRGPARYGVLAAPLAADDVALAVDFSLSKAALEGGTEQNARDLLTACYVDGEYLAYADATLTGAYQYDLGHLVRGAYGSESVAHAAGAPFVRLDQRLFRYAYPRSWNGKTIWFKLASFNKFGNGLQDLADVPSYQHTIVGASVATVVALQTYAQLFSILIQWELPEDSEDVAYTELWYSQEAAFNTAVKYDAYAAPQNAHTINVSRAGVGFFFWVRPVDKLGNLGEFYPNGVGVYGQSSADAAAITDFLAGKISKTQLAQDLIEPIEAIENVQDLLDALPDAAVVNQIISKQAGADADQDALAATQLIALATADASDARTRTLLGAKFGSAQAQILAESHVRAAETGALAESINTVQAVVNEAAAAVEETSTALAETNDKLAATYAVKTQVTSGGIRYFAGFALGVELDAGVVTSQFLVSADRFAIINEANGVLTSPFVVQGGQMIVNSAVIGDASIGTAKIANAAITNAKFGGDIWSDNWVYGVSGWYLSRLGALYAHSGEFRGQLIAASGTFSGSLTAQTIVTDNIVTDALTDADNFTSGVVHGTTFVVSKVAKVLLIIDLKNPGIAGDGNWQTDTIVVGVAGVKTKTVAISGPGVTTVTLALSLPAGTYSLYLYWNHGNDPITLPANAPSCFILKVKK